VVPATPVILDAQHALQQWDSAPISTHPLLKVVLPAPLPDVEIVPQILPLVLLAKLVSSSKQLLTAPAQMYPH